ncbi:MAG TPA: glycosyl hydrolase [Paludibacter sp.]
MLRSYRIFYFICIAFVGFIFSCTPNNGGDEIPPKLMSSSPADSASNVDTSTVITIQYNEKVVLSSNAQIRLNGEVVAAKVSVSGYKLTITASLQAGTSYTLIVPDNTISDVAGNFAKATAIHFTTFSSVSSVESIFEAESATLSGGAVIAKTTNGYSGTGYVDTNAGNVAFTVQTVQTGYYNVSFRYLVSADKVNDLYVDGSLATSVKFPASTSWSEVKAGTLKLTAGLHTISLVKQWGYIQLDYLKVTSDSVGPNPFNIASSLVTPNPSTQAVNLYNFLKTNFGTNIISGTMANYSTNITEATWVHTQTGKWPALTGFDFIDNTNPNQSWIKYTAPFTLGQDWWNNNGIVNLMWHWRDPLTKSGAFYTADTNFDIRKISDTNSAEYKAMIVDIDIISGYLKQFKDAGIPVIWRPLHEASGGWFWWGAKGAEPCKALWRLMFDRMVNYHGLNNMIWVWTSDVASNAASWYPGDAYVDVIGMDIYPGNNQHGSQYIAFNKVKDIFGGKKLITLSECGSVPDPALMKEFGDTWSWFMPWNGDYTESDTHNGATWWKKFFSYDYVITRDKMPSLK